MHKYYEILRKYVLAARCARNNIVLPDLEVFLNGHLRIAQR